MRSTRILLWISIFILLLATVTADDKLYFSTDQAEYYFLLGQKAVIPVQISNSYQEAVSGLLTLQVSSTVRQGNSQYSSSNQNSQSFNAERGNGTISLDLGSSQQPMELDISLQFSYTDPDDEEFLLTVPTLKVFFVEKPEEQQNQQEEQQSSYQSQEEIKEEQQKQAQEKQKRREEELREQIKQQKNQNQMQNRLQNNQLNQNTNILKQEMERQQKLQEEFAQNLAQQEELKQEQEKLEQEGYKLENEELTQKDAQNGEFKQEYQNEQGDTVNLAGSLKNNTLENLERSEYAGEETILDKVEQDPRFQEYDQELANEGFTRQGDEITRQKNKTKVEILYQNNENETAAITAIVEENEVKEVELERNRNWLQYLLMSGAILLAGGIFLSRKFPKVKDLEKEFDITEPINYRNISKKLLKRSKELFREKSYKDAYGKAAEAVRFYYSHEFELRRELTNTELITHLRRQKYPIDKIQKCLNLCGLVSFAKYRANKKDFDEIIKIAEKIVR